MTSDEYGNLLGALRVRFDSVGNIFGTRALFKELYDLAWKMETDLKNAQYAAGAWEKEFHSSCARFNKLQQSVFDEDLERLKVETKKRAEVVQEDWERRRKLSDKYFMMDDKHEIEELRNRLAAFQRVIDTQKTKIVDLKTINDNLAKEIDETWKNRAQEYWSMIIERDKKIRDLVANLNDDEISTEYHRREIAKRAKRYDKDKLDRSLPENNWESSVRTR
jgi:hypothetical protein